MCSSFSGGQSSQFRAKASGVGTIGWLSVVSYVRAMSRYEDFDLEEYDDEHSPDPEEINAKETIKEFFEKNQEAVFYSRQIEVIHEKPYFHWLTNRAIRELAKQGDIRSQQQELSTGGTVNLYWHKSNRFYKRSAKRVVELVQEYTEFSHDGALGLHGERMVLHAFARFQFVHQGENTREFNGKAWEKSEHDLDFIFERDSIGYGIEVKNTLNYMDYKEFKIKVNLCKHLGIRPVFAVRMIPKTWIKELIDAGGYAMILKYQLYPLSHQELAKKMVRELNLPVDTPRSIQQGTMDKFLHWHWANV